MTENQPEAPAVPGVTRYRVREPVTVEAIEWTGENADAVRDLGAAPELIPPGCYVVKGVTGHVFTVDAERFAATYEPAGETGVPAASPPPVAAVFDREHLGRIAHEVRCAENAKRDRPFRLEPWERRAPSQQELDMKIGEAVAAAVLGSDEKGPDLD